MADCAVISKEEKRGGVRVATGIPITIRKSCGHGRPARLTDATTHGCRINTSFRAREGDRLWVRIPGMESLPAITVWSDGIEHGLAFERPLHPAVFDRLAGLRSAG